jgi:hypothetical protein
MFACEKDCPNGTTALVENGFTFVTGIGLLLFETLILTWLIVGTGFPVMVSIPDVEGRTQLIDGFKDVAPPEIVILCTNGMTPTDPTAGPITEVLTVPGEKVGVVET